MKKDERDLLEVLKVEREFLERGGYSQSPRSSWRPRYIFEDSPSCANYGAEGKLVSCRDCVLMQLVPSEHRAEKFPCRYIPLNTSGETLTSLYRYSDQNEIEKTVGDWLTATIERVEKERALLRPIHAQQTCGAESVRGMPLYETQHPKCANPACHTAFHWTGGGKFFRFRPESALADGNSCLADAPHGIHGVRHYWLCQPCSEAFTLAYDEGNGVTLQMRWPELPATETNEESACGKRLAAHS